MDSSFSDGKDNTDAEEKEENLLVLKTIIPCLKTNPGTLNIRKSKVQLFNISL